MEFVGGSNTIIHIWLRVMLAHDQTGRKSVRHTMESVSRPI